MSTPKMSPPQLIGLVLCRGIVPLWVMTGAIFKLTEKSPSLLPQSIWRTAADVEINLYWLLAILILIEFTLVGVMFFLARLARPAAIFTLSVFCIVLIIELLRGSESCGCLGGASPPPWLMLTIDGIMLLGVIAFAPPRPARPEWLPSGPATVTAMWILGSLSVTAAMILPETRPNNTIIAQPAPVQNPDAAPDPDQPDSGPSPSGTPTAPQRSIPSLVTVKPAEWVGRNWSDVTLATYVSGWTDAIASGRHYVIFYSRSCDHCRSLLNYFFYDPPANTTIVAVPETKAGFDRDAELPMDCPGCVELELPIGTEWFFTPPLVVALEDGVVKCAAEGVDADVDQPQCLIWH